MEDVEKGTGGAGLENAEEQERGGSKKNGNKAWYMAASVIISVIIWAMVVYMTDPDVSKTVHSVRLRFIGEETLQSRGLIVTGAEDIPDLAVKISGKRSDMAYAIDNVVVEVNVADIEATGEYELQGNVILPNSRITLERIRFDTVPVTVEEYTEKEIDIEIRQTGTLRGRIVRSEANVDKVRISGAKSEIDAVDSGYSTVDISALAGSGELRSGFVMVDSNGSLITRNETIETDTPDIVITNTVYNTAELPVEAELSGSIADGYILNKEETKITPDTVTVGLLPGTEAASVKAEITSAAAGEYKLREDDGMYIPPGTGNVWAEPSVYTKNRFEASVAVEVRGVAEGLHVEGAPYTEGGFYGVGNDIGSVHAYVDASGLGEGTYTLPVIFESDAVLPDGELTAEVTLAR